ncbi:MAG: hypothetical protein HGA61_04645 [Candidatus Moranbacteria bacterium]|nr:hypothetical protein [Candidatus Moranbacteria bacterium]
MFRKKYRNKSFVFAMLVAFFLIGLFFFVHNASAAGGLVPCGKTGEAMCTLCDLIKGINGIIQYLLKLSVGVALTAIAVGGVIYAASVGNPKMIETAKEAMKNALIGLLIILTAWLIINTLLLAIGTQTNLGVNGVTSWGKFECTANSSK